MQESKEYIFDPIANNSNLFTLVYLGITILLLTYYFFYNKKELSYDQRKRKGMINLVLLTGVLIAGAATLLNWWNYKGIKQITIKENSISLPNSDVDLKKIKKVYVKVYKPMTIGKPVPDSIAKYERSLILEEIGKTQPHILSEDDYPIDEIFQAVKKITKK